MRPSVCSVEMVSLRDDQEGANSVDCPIPVFKLQFLVLSILFLALSLFFPVMVIKKFHFFLSEAEQHSCVHNEK